MAVLALILLAGIALGWVFTGAPVDSKQLSQDTLTNQPQPPAPRAPALGLSQPNIPDSSQAATPGAAARPLSSTAAQPAPWQDTVEAILAAETADPDKARQLLELLPGLSPEAQIEVAQDISVLLPDDQYAAVRQYLTDPGTSESVFDVLLSGLMDRPDAVKLPLLIEIARTEQNSRAADAKALLEASLGENYGDNWNQWEASIEHHLQQAPD